jgi:hypothetical protein
VNNMAVSSGVIRGGYLPVQQPTKINNKMDTYPASILQAGQDYDELMKRYRSIIDRGQDPQLSSLAQQYKNLGNQSYTPDIMTPTNIPAPSLVSASTTNSFSPITAAEQTYTRAPEVSGAMKNLEELSRTGGYSDSDISNLRARGISPIRSVYSNAMKDITRQRALQGGYSPNYTASIAKLTRDLSEGISGATQNVNAGIAQNVASNRLSAAPQYASAAGQENALLNSILGSNAAARNRASEFNTSGLAQQGQFNTSNINRANEINTSSINDINAANAAGINRANEYNITAGNTSRQINLGTQQQLLGSLTQLYQTEQEQKNKALSGMASLYGTTPANPALYGSQALQKAQLEEQQKARKQQGSGTLINAYMNAVPRGIQAGGSLPGARF